MASIICLFEMVHLNDFLFDELVDNVVKEALKLSILVAQMAAAPKNDDSKAAGMMHDAWCKMHNAWMIHDN